MDRPTPESLREVLGTFATGVAVVTCGQQGRDAAAVTVNSFTSVSLDPPMVLFCLDKSAFHRDRFLKAERFAINILAETEDTLSNRFAAEKADLFPDLATRILKTGCPIFRDSLAALDCERDKVHEAGDHYILLGRVIALTAPREAAPLIYFRGRYASLNQG